MTNVSVFLVGMTLTMFVILRIVWMVAWRIDRKGTDWDRYSSEVIMSGIVMFVILLIIFSSIVMMMLNYFYKPFPLDNMDMFIAGSITGIIIVIVWKLFGTVLDALKIPDDAWQTKLLSGSPYIVVLISFAVLYYFFS